MTVTILVLLPRTLVNKHMHGSRLNSPRIGLDVATGRVNEWFAFLP